MAIDEEQVVVEEEAIEDTEVSEEETPAEEQEEESTEEVDEEVEDRIVTIGDSEPEEEEEHKEAPGWVKTVRKVNRQQEREIKRLKKQLEEVTKPAEETVELGPKPTLQDANFDDKKFEADLITWHERKRKVEEQQKAKEKAIEEQNRAWQEKQERYASLEKEHNFKDFKETESIVSDTFNQTQQGVLVQGADDPVLLVYALGKNLKKLEELSKITDPIVLAAKLGKLEAQLKVTSRKAPAPEKRVTGGKTGSGSVDKTLDRLREEAERTGDYSKVHAYKRKLQGAK